MECVVVCNRIGIVRMCQIQRTKVNTNGKKPRTGSARDTTAKQLRFSTAVCMRVCCEYLPLPAFFMLSNSHVCYIGKRGISRMHTDTHLQSQRNAFNLPKVFACITEMFAYVCMCACECTSGMSLGNRYVHGIYVHFTPNACIEFVCMSSTFKRLQKHNMQNIYRTSD